MKAKIFLGSLLRPKEKVEEENSTPQKNLSVARKWAEGIKKGFCGTKKGGHAAEPYTKASKEPTTWSVGE